MAPDIDTLLPPSAVALDGVPTEKRTAIEFLVDRLVDAGRVTDRGQALADLREREAAGPTDFGLGVAIPHARTDAVSQPSLAFAQATAGVDFGAADTPDATLLFAILVPTDATDTHLEVLSSVSRALVHDDVRRALQEASTPAAVRQTLRSAVE